MKNILKILTVIFLVNLTQQIGYTQVKNCDGPFDVDLSTNTTHTFSEVLQQLGIATIEDFNNNKPKFDMVLGGILLLDMPNQEIIFDGTRIKMMEDASISVKNNTSLSLENSTYIFGCNKFWQGIFVESASINVNSSRIDDALTGIWALNKSKVTLHSVNFINNTRGLRIGEANQTEVQLSLSQCTFKTNDSYFEGTGIPICGIFVSNIPFIDLSPNTGEKNYYEDLQCGIYALSTSIRIIDSEFRNIHSDSDSKLFDHAIHLFNLSNKASGSSIINHNYFYNIDNAIKSSSANIYAQYNDIFCNNVGIFVQGAGLFNIKENFIGASSIGIKINSCQKMLSNKAFFSIHDNTLVVNDNAGAKGIEVDNADGLDIQKNVISMWNGEAGIYANESDKITIFDNDITAKGGYGTHSDCIQLISSNAADVSYNNLIQQPGFATCCVPQSRGLYSESAYGFIGCNYIDHFPKAGIAFMDECDNTKLDGNILNTNKLTVFGKDLVLGNEEVITFIGKQGDFSNKIGWGNRWTGDQGGSAYNYSPDNYVKYSQFLVNAFSNPDYKPMTIVAASNDWFLDRSDVTNESSCSVLPYDEGYKVGPEDFDCMDFINKIVQIDTARNLDDCKKDIWKYHYFKKFLIMKKMNLLTRECLNFFNSFNNDVLVKIAKVDSAISNILINQSTDTILYENIVNTQTDLNDLHDQGMVFTPQYQQTLTLYNQLLEDHSNLMEAERAEDNSKADSVKNVISTIIISDTCLSLLLRTLDIELDYIKSDTLTPVQLAFVREISEFCPYVFGDGVYHARALRSIYDNVSYIKTEDCDPERLNPRSNEMNSGTDKFYLYPNPASDELNIALNQEKESPSGLVRIIDVTGRILKEFKVDQPRSEYKIYTGTFKSGLYFIKYTSDSGHEMVEKFVILK